MSVVLRTRSNPGSLWYGFSFISDWIERSTPSRVWAALHAGPTQVLRVCVCEGGGGRVCECEGRGGCVYVCVCVCVRREDSECVCGEG